MTEAVVDFEDQQETQQSSRRGYLHLIVLVVLSVVAMFSVLWVVADQNADDKQYLSTFQELRVLSLKMVKFAAEASTAKVEGFSLLKSAREEFQQNVTSLRQGNAESGLPPLPSETETELQALEGRWDDFSKNAETILMAEGTIRILKEFARAINDVMPGLVKVSDDIAASIVKTGADAQTVNLATRQLLLSQRIEASINKLLQGGEVAAQATDQFGRDASTFSRVLEGMLKGDRELRLRRVSNANVRAKLSEASNLFRTAKELVAKILERSPELFRAQDAANKIFVVSDGLSSDIELLSERYQFIIEERETSYGLGFIFGVIALAALVLLGLQLKWDGDRRLRETELDKMGTDEKNQRNQEAILRLLDEIGGLAEGDLTISATVTDDFTGAIADAFNYAIEAIRRLVGTINETTVQVSSAAEETQATALHLAEASNQQAHDITAAGAAINEMAASVQQVSANANTASEVAKQSVDIAKKGAGTVRSTIQGMDAIRENIQETSKRIKRLGESSQEIGDIVELINDIADQTNILALNASIQAAMAGEAGRGFAVVADEVQRLAERSGNATKQIEALVRTIQTDTNEAVISMEQSTSGVVTGTRLAQDAGKALEEIERVSIHLANLIENISQAARQQSSAASNVSKTMATIQEITNQTSAGTSETAASIGNLAELANELRKSVAGFRLPAVG